MQEDVFLDVELLSGAHRNDPLSEILCGFHPPIWC
jgi:hypothetical protein